MWLPPKTCGSPKTCGRNSTLFVERAKRCSMNKVEFLSQVGGSPNRQRPRDANPVRRSPNREFPPQVGESRKWESPNPETRLRAVVPPAVLPSSPAGRTADVTCAREKSCHRVALSCSACFCAAPVLERILQSILSPTLEARGHRGPLPMSPMTGARSSCGSISRQSP